MPAPPEFISVPQSASEVHDALLDMEVPVSVGAFLVSRTEITQREYERITGRNPSHFRGKDRPVENVSWWDAIRYCNRRSEEEKLKPCYDTKSGRRDHNCTGYRLPTEAEWRKISEKTSPTPARLRDDGHRDTQRLLQDFEHQGTAPVGSFPPNALGIHDLYGNVWEWCEDWFNADMIIEATEDPSGPIWGTERVIRGGSFLTARKAWNKSFRSSMSPDHKSAFTGFRIVRSLFQARPSSISPEWLETFQKKPDPVRPLSQDLLKSSSRRIETVSDWRLRADGLYKKWMDVLGAPSLPKTTPTARIVKSLQELTWTGELLQLEVEETYSARILVVKPAHPKTKRLPVVIVPFYDVDSSAGVNLGGRRFMRGGTRAFAELAAQRGFMAVAIRWFGEGGGEGYDEAVLNLLRRHPQCTGLGEWVWNSQRLVDYLISRPDVDSSRIGIIGHSLGGKMALYAAAFDPRIKAIVSSEPGISFGFSNYDSIWYLGERIHKLPPGSDQQELLALIAPRPFLLIAGEDSDGDKSWPYVEAAQEVYSLFGKRNNIGMVNHRSGHSPTPEAVTQGMNWLSWFLQ